MEDIIKILQDTSNWNLSQQRLTRLKRDINDLLTEARSEALKREEARRANKADFIRALQEEDRALRAKGENPPLHDIYKLADEMFGKDII